MRLAASMAGLGHAHEADDACSRQAILLRDMRERHSRQAVPHQCGVINVERRTPNAAALKFCSAHTGADTFDYEGPLQFRDGRNDDNDCSTQSTFGVDSFTLGEKLYAKFVQLIENLKEMLSTPGKTIARPHQNRVELVTICVLEELIQRWAADLGSAHTLIDILLNDLIAALLGKRPQFDSLAFRMLINRGHSQIKGCTLQVITSAGMECENSPD